MKTLLAPTEDFIKQERSKLSTDASAGSNVTLVLENNDHFANTEYIVVGREGSEQAELCQINAAVSGGTDVRVATLVRSHKAGEPITKYRYNKRKFYGATSATGSYTELTGDGSPVTIQVDDPQGTLIEYSGSTYTYFKATYYNTSTSHINNYWSLVVSSDKIDCNYRCFPYFCIFRYLVDSLVIIDRL